VIGNQDSMSRIDLDPLTARSPRHGLLHYPKEGLLLCLPLQASAAFSSSSPATTLAVLADEAASLGRRPQLSNRQSINDLLHPLLWKTTSNGNVFTFQP
jgi:hypothetical protein